jgi:hypothetical protein
MFTLYELIQIVCTSLLVTIVASNLKQSFSKHLKRFLDKRRNCRRRSVVVPAEHRSLVACAAPKKKHKPRERVVDAPPLAPAAELVDAAVQTDANDAEERYSCVVCMAGEKEALFSCGHMCVCMTCAVKLPNCPICRIRVRDFRRVFL